MNCCDQCFKDPELKGYLLSRNPPLIGQCDFCHRNVVHLIEVTELEEYMHPVINLYTPVTEDGNLDNSEHVPLHIQIQTKWNIFSSDNDEQWKNLLVAIHSGVIDENDPIFTHPVKIAAPSNEDIGPFQEELWETFANEIKFGNRFFLTKDIDLPLLEDLLKGLSKIYPTGTVFYRGRVGQKDGFAIEEMGKPIPAKATSGRANPEGIPYLYVAKDIETTLYESRCTYLDYVTIAEFRSKEALTVISLRGISNISPFLWQDKLRSYVINEKYLTRLESELSRPLRRFDNPLDYLPTQYLCEFVKSLGYDGIEYGSSLHTGGVNLAIFNDSKLQATAVSLHEVVSIELSSQQV